jgi:hypothetical protein
MPSAGLIAHREDAKNTAGSNNLRILRFLAMKFRQWGFAPSTWRSGQAGFRSCFSGSDIVTIPEFCGHLQHKRRDLW